MTAPFIVLFQALVVVAFLRSVFKLIRVVILGICAVALAVRRAVLAVCAVCAVL